MSDYTPTTETIRDRIMSSNYTQSDQPDLGEAFDRWLATHDAEMYQRGREDAALSVTVLLDEVPPTPWREVVVNTIIAAEAAARGDGEQDA